MTALVFVDTNLLLYAADDGEPLKRERAKAWLDELWREQLGRTSMQVLSEFYVNLKRRSVPAMDDDTAWRRAGRYFAWDPQIIDAALLQRAREVERRWRLSWWDSLIVAAAQFQQCALLLTEDLQDGADFGGVRVRSPFTLGLHEDRATYDPVPVARSRHRPRGRPAKSPG